MDAAKEGTEVKESVAEAVVERAPEPAAVEPLKEPDSDRNPVFEQLVSGDSDIVGLVAYSIYKQHKRDWLIAFKHAKGRTPTDEESVAYIIGESTPRRLATFRHLAQATLDGRGLDVAMGVDQGQRSVASAAPQRSYPIAQRPQSAAVAREVMGVNPMLSYAGLGIVALVAFYLLFRFGLPTVGR
jgi:hypothetical protein